MKHPKRSPTPFVTRPSDPTWTTETTETTQTTQTTNDTRYDDHPRREIIT
jgi:hypothetical protein